MSNHMSSSLLSQATQPLFDLGMNFGAPWFRLIVTDRKLPSKQMSNEKNSWLLSVYRGLY